MDKKNFDRLEFITSLVTAILLFVLTFLQFKKQRTFAWLILLAAIMMAANAYTKYKKYKNQ